jgi:hypothetical protein
MTNGWKQKMYKIISILEEKRITATAELTLTLAQCCHCGEIHTILKQNVLRANKENRKHCSKCVKENFHLMTNTRIWSIWKGMISRATKEYDRSYILYGGKGKGVAKEWLDFKNFYSDMKETYSDNLTLDRIDNSKGYSKDNCRWATNMEQQANKINNRVLVYKGKQMHLSEFCRVVNISRGAITPRLNLGMTPEDAVTNYLNSKYPKNRRSRKYLI